MPIYINRVNKLHYPDLVIRASTPGQIYFPNEQDLVFSFVTPTFTKVLTLLRKLDEIDQLNTGFTYVWAGAELHFYSIVVHCRDYNHKVLIKLTI